MSYANTYISVHTLFKSGEIMKTILVKIILLFGFLLCISCSNTIVHPYWEIPDPSLPEIAMIRADPHWGTAVIYNPDTCKEIGEACGFFRLHAFAHEHLNHNLLATPSAYPASSETQADCWAAKYGEPNETYAVVQIFLNENIRNKWKIHGDPEQRADTIRTCAIEAGRWTGNT
jgi:hypothetical protein